LISELVRKPVPTWLMDLKSAENPLPITNIQDDSVFYPACGMDGHPVEYLGGFSHSFVYVDWNARVAAVMDAAHGFRGYRVLFARPAEPSELCFRPFQPLLPAAEDDYLRAMRERQASPPFAHWIVLERLPDHPESHGPERLSLLYVCGEGVATFQHLYFSNQAAPSVVALIRSDAFTGNWTSFCNPDALLARSVMENPHGRPDYFYTDHRRKPPWPWYPKLVHRKTIVLRSTSRTPSIQVLQLWQRDPGAEYRTVESR